MISKTATGEAGALIWSEVASHSIDATKIQTERDEGVGRQALPPPSLQAIAGAAQMAWAPEYRLIAHRA